MKNNFYFFSVAILAGGLLVMVPAISAQRGSMGANSQQQPGMAPSPGLPNVQGITEPAFVSHIRRNGEIETNLSKIEMKNGNNDAVKKLAQQVMSETRKSDMILNGTVVSNPNLGTLPYEQVPDVTRQAVKQMKSLTGAQVDQIYLSQINAYIQDDQRTIDAALSSLKGSDLETTLPRLKEISDNQAKQIAQVAQSENIKIE